jgi:cation transport ATPase
MEMTEQTRPTGCFWDVVLNAVMLLPAMVFWISVLMVANFGNDYLFDMLLAKIGLTWWGNLLLIFFVVAMPAVSIAINGMEHMLSKKTVNRVAMMIGAVLLALGFYAVMKKG